MEVGRVLLERYRIDQVLGTGGMGVVVAATDLSTAQRVALKLLTPDRSHDADAIARLLREAAATTRLVGRHTGRILDVAQTPAGEPLLVMELLDGEDLARRLAREGPVREVEAVAMVLDACEGLAEAHAMRLIHRDVKPSNLFLARDVDGAAHVKVIDFGVVKVDGASGDTLTRTSSLIGSVAYMAPEQLRRQPIDARADVWSLGVVLYELVTGTRPFRAETITDASIRIAVEPPEPLPATVSDRTAAVIARCLEKDPARRYQDVAELAAALAPPDDDRPARIRRILGRAGAIARAAPTRERRSLAVRARDGLANHWFALALGVCLWSLALLLGSFAVSDRLNEFRIGHKRTGYMSSFNWTLVHTFLSPIALAVLGLLLRTATATFAGLGREAARAWDARARAILTLGLVMSLTLAVGYTVVEWSFVTTGRCDGGTFLGWPNQLCHEAGGSIASLVFMGLAAFAQAELLCVGWFLLATVIGIGDLLFGKHAVALDDHGHARAGRLFAIATWGWATIFVALFIARVWCVHLRTPDTEDVIATVMQGFPGSLLAIDAHTQTDWGSMIAGSIILVAALAPIALLRRRVSAAAAAPLAVLERAVAIFCSLGLVAMIFPRLGFFLLPASATIALGVPRVRRALVAAWPR